VIDMDNDRAGIFTAALKEGRSGVWITSQSSDVQQRLRLQTIFAQGFLGYCKTTLGSEETLNTDCFLRTGLIEGYVEFLQVSFHPSKRR